MGMVFLYSKVQYIQTPNQEMFLSYQAKQINNLNIRQIKIVHFFCFYKRYGFFFFKNAGDGSVSQQTHVYFFVHLCAGGDGYHSFVVR